MGAQSAVKLRNRGIAFKCNLCGRKLMTSDALVAHQRTAHNIITKRRERPKISPKDVKSVRTHDKSHIESKAPNQSECKKIEENSEMKKNMVEFECPKCFKRFPTYFPALKHIQKYHCVNRNNVNVAPNHPSLIQPVRIELCLKCNLKVKSIQTHICDNLSKDSNDKKMFVCTACDEWFPNLKGFDCHVLSIHGDGVESMFFPTSIEFTSWKTDMEQQTKVSYAVLDKYDSKRYYHCNYVKDNHEKVNTTYFCPSTIVIQEFSKGIQVHFYKQHYKHGFSDYELSSKYKKYSITSFLKRSDDYNNLVHLKSDDNDLYMQFKTLMEGIVVDAAKINIATLKIILGKALEITSILTNYDEEIDDNNMVVVRTSTDMTDLQMTEALEQPLAKRRIAHQSNTADPSDVKRVKIDLRPAEKQDTSSPKIVNSFSLANTDYIKNLITPSENGKETTQKEADKEVTQEGTNKEIQQDADKEPADKKMADKDVNGDDIPSSFNDSYKDFVVKNFPNMETIATRSRTRPILKTRVGQFKPNLSQMTIKTYERQRKPETPKLTPIEIKPEEKSKVLESVNDPRPKPTNKISIVKNSESPKAQVITKTNQSRISFDKPKVDYEYEVKEQADDCNILILKIL